MLCCFIWVILGLYHTFLILNIAFPSFITDRTSVIGVSLTRYYDLSAFLSSTSSSSPSSLSTSSSTGNIKMSSSNSISSENIIAKSTVSTGPSTIYLTLLPVLYGLLLWITVSKRFSSILAIKKSLCEFRSHFLFLFHLICVNQIGYRLCWSLYSSTSNL